jgi:hypothetical protein
VISGEATVKKGSVVIYHGAFKLGLRHGLVRSNLKEFFGCFCC